MTFIDIFTQLCNDINKAPTAVCVEVGLSDAIYTYWKKHNSAPRPAMLKKIADYFGVSPDYLLGLTTKEYHQPVTNNHEATTVTADGSERKLTELELELLNIFEKLNVIEQAKLLVYASELAGNK